MQLSPCLLRVQRRAPEVRVPTQTDSRPPLVSKAVGPARPSGIPKGHPSTPINELALANELRLHPDSGFVNHLLTGLSRVSKNLQSALEDPECVSQLLDREVKKGHLIGRFNPPVFRISPVGVATRKYSGKKCLVFDLSAPHPGPVPSVNDLIPLAPFSFHYATVDNAIKLIKMTGRGAWLSKADITDAFKIVPILPSQWHLFGIKWRSKFYFAVRLTFRCRSSPCLFNMVSEALCWILLNNSGLPSVLHLLDDFLLIDSPRDNSGASLSKLKHLFHRLGVPLSEEKTSGPATSLEFLSIKHESFSPRRETQSNPQHYSVLLIQNSRL